MMRSTIMTEKIKRRGVSLPESYYPDVLELKTVADIMKPLHQQSTLIIKESQIIKELKAWFRSDGAYYTRNIILVVADDNRALLGAVNRNHLFESEIPESEKISSIMKKVYTIYKDNSLLLAVEFMLKTDQDLLPVVDRSSDTLIGVITEQDILRSFEQRFHEEKHLQRHISMKEKTLDVIRKSRGILKGKGIVEQ